MRRIMRVLATVFAGLLLLLPLSTGPANAATREVPAGPPVVFSDVTPNDYFYVPVQYLASHNIISGYPDGTFRPYNNTTRGQLLKMLVIGENWAIDTTNGPHFSDVPEGSTFYTYIETGYSHGIISGYANGTFHPGEAVTRAQVAKIVVGTHGWTVRLPSVQHFSDVGMADMFYPYIETAYAHGLLSGYADGTYRPGSPATRGQIAKIVANALLTSDNPTTLPPTKK